MIAFDLICGTGHKFEGWFASSNDFETQQSGRLLSCPVCDDFRVSKALSVPNVGRKGNRAVAATSPDVPALIPAVGEVMNAPTLPPQMVEIMQKLAIAQSEILRDSQWVGRNFAETARAIHYGEADVRLIHGETSADEAGALIEEGISIAPLPFPVIPPAAKN